MQVRQSPGDTGWFVHDRFGLFLRYDAVPAAGRRGEIEAVTDVVRRRVRIRA